MPGPASTAPRPGCRLSAEAVDKQAGSLNVLAVNDPDQSELFIITEPQVEEALAAMPELRDRVRVTVCGRDDGTLHERAVEADVIIGWEFDHRNTVSVAERLRLIHIIGAGYEHLVPFDDWLPAGITVTNSSGVHKERAGEFVACALLMINSKIPQHFTSQRKHTWRSVYSDTIEGKTVTIVGVGTIGSEAARKAKGLGLLVRGVRSKPFEHPHVDEAYGFEDLDRAIEGADFLLLTASLTERTRGMIDAERLALLKPGAGVINIARAGLMDYDALTEALGTGQVGAAIVDVFDPEPLPADAPWWDCENFVVTPHVSSDPIDYNRRMLTIAFDNCRRLLDGEELRNVIRK